jgi:hypothetical protein
MYTTWLYVPTNATHTPSGGSHRIGIKRIFKTKEEQNAYLLGVKDCGKEAIDFKDDDKQDRPGIGN